MRHFLNLSFNIKFLIMNKKFSTLMAGLMLASAFSVASAQQLEDEYVNGKYYLLGNTTDGFISINSTPGSNYGRLTLQPSTVISGNLQETREALWKVTVTEGNVGETPKFVYENVATGIILNISENDFGNGTALLNPIIAGSYMEWYNGVSLKTNGTNAFPLMSYTDKDEVIYFTANAAGDLVANLGTPATAEVNGMKVNPYIADPILNLDEDALNTQLGKIENGDSFNLYFNEDVTEGAEPNLLAETSLTAVDATPGYVRLFSEDADAYVVVDTAYHKGTENTGKLVKYTYAKLNADAEHPNNVNRYEDSYEFAFAYVPFEDRILIKSKGYYTKKGGTVASRVTGADGNVAYTYWGFNADYTENLKVNDAYVRLAKLSTINELTVANQADPTTGTKPGAWDEYTNGDFGMATTVRMTANEQTYVPTTIAEGLYMIKLHTSGYDQWGNKRTEADGDYYIASLKGNFGYAEQAKNQNYDHMPAAQWYISQNGTSETAPITITNREFSDLWTGGQVQAFKAADGQVFFRSGNLSGDTLEFIPVSASSKKEEKLGYKHVDEKQASIETYYFNYLHGLALDKGLNTPIDNDSLVRVDETGEKIAFRLIPVVKDDSYGIQLDAKKTGIAKLIRNAYYIEAYDNLKFAADGRSRYLSFNSATNKYVMTTVPTAYFLKENNCIDGTHYYALVDAKLYGIQYAYLDQATAYTYRTSVAGTTDNVSYMEETFRNNLLPSIYPAKYVGMDINDAHSYAWLKNDPKSPLTPTEKANLFVPFYDEDGEPVIWDDSEGVALYAYMPNTDGVITLQRLAYRPAGGATIYYALNPVGVHESLYHSVSYNDTQTLINTDTPISWASTNYADSRISVDDNTLDLFKTLLDNNNWNYELRVSAFEAQVNDSPLYRRFNGANGEYGTEANAPLNLKFFRHNNNAEYLFENYASENEYRDGINDKEISFLGVNNAFQFPESETRSYTMFVDTAFVRNNTRMPQYLIGIRPEVVLGDTTLCDATTHQHKTPEEALACEHTKINVGFTRAMYLFNAQDSVDVKNYDYQGKAAYGAQGYTRLAFKDAVHANDTLYILNPGVTTEELKACNLKNDKLFAKKIALDNNKHKNVVFQFRLVTDEDNRFLIESEAEENGKAVFNKDLKNVSVAPMRGGWVKIQNGVPVIARFDDFNEAIAQAEIFDVNDEIKYDATANDEIAVEGVTVVAGNGQVTIMGAAGKNVTITNILGKVIASQVIASDNATIAVPAGIVAVAVEGEAAVKAIVK